jgi:hypothetical protein
MAGRGFASAPIAMVSAVCVRAMSACDAWLLCVSATATGEAVAGRTVIMPCFKW